MTPARYLVARFAKAFGWNRRQRRMSDAAAESHLLREAEQVLGLAVWERVENVEALGIEYWNLRRITKEKAELEQQLVGSEASLTEAHEQRVELMNAKSDLQIELEEKRSVVIAELEELAKKRDAVIREARDIRRVYDGLKMKFEVTERDGESQLIEDTRTRMNELRDRFNSLKDEREEVTDAVTAKDLLVKEIDELLHDERQKHREIASTAFQQIGQMNRDISSTKAQYGLLEAQARQLYSEIGRHISRNSHVNEQCRAAAKGHIPMIEVMEALRKSVTMNHRLAEG